MDQEKMSELAMLDELSNVFEAHFVNEVRTDVVAVRKDLLAWAVSQIRELERIKSSVNWTTFNLVSEQRDRLREGLLKLAWQSVSFRAGYTVCLACHAAAPPQVHNEGCWLAELLK